MIKTGFGAYYSAKPATENKSRDSRESYLVSRDSFSSRRDSFFNRSLRPSGFAQGKLYLVGMTPATGAGAKRDDLCEIVALIASNRMLPFRREGVWPAVQSPCRGRPRLMAYPGSGHSA